MLLRVVIRDILPMKTTVELSDDLYRRAKATAAMRGLKFKELVEEGLRRVMAAPETEPIRPRLSDLMRDARGVVCSDVPDLASIRLMLRKLCNPT